MFPMVVVFALLLSVAIAPAALATGGGCVMIPEPRGTGQLGGRVMGEANRMPLSGIEVIAQLLNQRGGTSCVWRQVRTDNGGRYSVSGLPPGKYLLAVTGPASSERPYVSAFYPGVTRRELAVIISVEDGTRRNDIDIALPGPLPVKELRIRVLDGKGTGVDNAKLSVCEPVGGCVVGLPDTDHRGDIVVEAFSGVEYVIWAATNTPEPLHSEPVLLVPTGGGRQLVLRLTSAGTHHDHH